MRITLDAERRVTLEGSLDDPRIRQVLVSTIKGYENPGIRLDTLDALRMHTKDPSIREALLYALGHDPNAGVRLEALKTVRHMECDEDTHRVLLHAVEHDSNVGVRTAAVDALVQHLQEEGMDDEVLTAFEKLAASDQDPVVRMRCLSAVRRLQGNE
ncbi:MAG: HEAT repeat domain-containing protein [Acidobacteriia bacterium]|nr:HEAT repeat domain-containing protein [Terriglobia bacterium]